MVLLTEHTLSFAQHRRTDGESSLFAAEPVEVSALDLASFLARRDGDRTVARAGDTVRVSYHNQVGVLTYVAEVYGDAPDLDAFLQALA